MLPHLGTALSHCPPMSNPMPTLCLLSGLPMLHCLPESRTLQCMLPMIPTEPRPCHARVVVAMSHSYYDGSARGGGTPSKKMRGWRSAGFRWELSAVDHSVSSFTPAFRGPAPRDDP